MKTAAIYARYSTDLQNPRSIQDQYSYCQDFADREGLKVVQHFSDQAMSGASIEPRKGLKRLLAACERGEFEVLIVEALDRLSRDIGDTYKLFKILTFHGVGILSVITGNRPVTEMEVMLGGMMAQMQRTQGNEKVKRGMSGVVREGRSAGGELMDTVPSWANQVSWRKCRKKQQWLCEFSKSTSPDRPLVK